MEEHKEESTSEEDLDVETGRGSGSEVGGRQRLFQIQGEGGVAENEEEEELQMNGGRGRVEDPQLEMLREQLSHPSRRPTFTSLKAIELHQQALDERANMDLSNYAELRSRLKVSFSLLLLFLLILLLLLTSLLFVFFHLTLL
jgi:hypothetical protein